MVRTKPDFGIEFVQLLIDLTNQDRLIWQQYNFGKKQDSSIAYLSPWMLCLDTDGRHPVLQVARHARFFTELEGLEYNLVVLDSAIASQKIRAEMARRQLTKIADEKIKEFGQDKILREITVRRKRLQILKECTRTLRFLQTPFEIEGT